jgi:hypothetical protein
MRTITTIGLDIAKSVFQVHGVDAVGQVVIRRQLKRRRTVCAFAVVTFICAVTYGTSHAAPIAPLTGIQTGHLIQVYSHHYRHSLPVIIVPPARRYGYQPYWWPQGQYHWSPYGLERWGYWCEPAGAHRLSC